MFICATEILSYFKDRLQDKMPQMYANLLVTYLRKWGFERKHKNYKSRYYVFKKSPEDVDGDGKITAVQLHMFNRNNTIAMASNCPY